MMKNSSTPWWRTDAYQVEAALPRAVYDLSGPKDVALVKAWPDGRTQPGWGLTGADGAEGFMPRYLRGEFHPRRVLYGYDRDRWTFAIVMRSVSLVCIDIDGKNGGLEHAKRLGMLPPTMSETSKSGDGYHLFYEVEEKWDDAVGYALLGDRIGIEQGVDVRATGCVYHHKQQRWNGRAPALLPHHLRDLLLAREQKVAAVTRRIEKVLSSNDNLEVLMMQDEILSDLAKPIPVGKRNVTLFALGNQMRQAQIEGWEDKLRDRATQLGLDTVETEKVLGNITRYGVTVAP